MQFEASQLAKFGVPVVPDRVKPKHMSVVVQKLLERVRALVRSQRILRAVLHLPNALVGIGGRLHRVRHTHTQLGQEVARERIAVDELEPLAVELELLLHVKVLDCVEGVVVGLGARYPVPVDDYALVVAGVLGARLHHLYGVVLQVEVDAHVTHAILFARALHHRLLEVGLEAEHLFVERHPGRLVRSFA